MKWNEGRGMIRVPRSCSSKGWLVVVHPVLRIHEHHHDPVNQADKEAHLLIGDAGVPPVEFSHGPGELHDLRRLSHERPGSAVRQSFLLDEVEDNPVVLVFPIHSSTNLETFSFSTSLTT